MSFIGVIYVSVVLTEQYSKSGIGGTVENAIMAVLKSINHLAIHEILPES